MNLCRIYHPLNKIKPRLIQSFKFASVSFNKTPFSIVKPLPKIESMTRLSTSHQFLNGGITLCKNLISFRGQVEIVKICQEFGVRPGGFYQPCNQIGEKQLGRHMMCFGRNWDPQRKSDGSEVPPIPQKLMSLVETSIRHFNWLLKLISSNRDPYGKLPLMSPDVCIVNFIEDIIPGQPVFHQDCNESSDSLKRELPLVSIFIGDSAEFMYGYTSKEYCADSVLVESGDVLIFGRRSRHNFYGLKRILPDSASMSLLEESRLEPGCLNLTFKRL